jgi:metallo-beta-lactamase family protein
MRILLTGATGFIGGALIVELIQQNFNISIVIRQKTNLFPDKVKQFIVVDFEGNPDFSASLAEVDCVIHLAGKAHVIDKSKALVLGEFRKINWVTLPGCKIRLQPAGHILRSSFVEIKTGSGQQHHTTVFSGDLGAPHTPLLPAPKSPYCSDTLVLESTYGDKTHPGRKERVKTLQTRIESCLKNRGTVLIPAFSIGRTQELLYEIEQIIHRQGKKLAAQGIAWEDLDIIVDSPLANKFSEVYKTLATCLDGEAKRRVQRGRHPLSFEQLLTINDHQEHLRTIDYLKQSGRPAIVIAASGMCSGGRIVNYLKALIEDPRTDVLFVGYQAKGTIGRKIQKYGPQNGYVQIDIEKFTIAAGGGNHQRLFGSCR